ncbi:MAG: ADP-ribosylglycohydrolase family protein [Rubricoccaceae bacterium]|nr:ADP-ribosylglycohydrolase family protein [Rubricoccaceae bacterium]
MPLSEQKTDRILGALLGGAVGDALGMPVTGFSHQNIRTFYKGIKEYRDDERRGELAAGRWTAHTQRIFALCRALTESGGRSDLRNAISRVIGATKLRRSTSDAGSSSHLAALIAPLGVKGAIAGWPLEEIVAHTVLVGNEVNDHPSTLAAAVGQTVALSISLTVTSPIEGTSFCIEVAEGVREAERSFGSDESVSTRIISLADHLNEFPLDLQDLCNGTGSAADEAFPFAIAMFARGPDLPEATLLSGINVGGDASVIGTMVGALLGARNGWSAFLEEWRTGLEDVDRLVAEAQSFISTLAD